MATKIENHKVTRVEAKDDPTDDVGTAKAKYSQLETTRFPALNRARESAKVTIPTLMPQAGHNNSTKYVTPYQSVGARGVNNLASKLLLALMPANTAFFKLQVDDAVLTQFGAARGDVELALSSMERTVINDINASSTRVNSFEALKQLIIAGNVLINLPKDGGMRVFRLDRYVVQRDVMGNPLCIVVKEEVAPSMLDMETRIACGLQNADSEEYSDGAERNQEVYTFIERDEETGKWEVFQEINGKLVPNSSASYPVDKTPWIALRMIAVDNEDYGRGFVEEYIGDLKSLEGLSKAVLEGSVASAKMIWMVNPNGSTNKRTISQANNNAVVEGHAGDVSVLQAQKYADFRVALETMKDLTGRLSLAFLLNTAIQRSGERVTAEEIRYMAKELEDGLGGIYSVLTQEFLLPLLQREMVRMTTAGKIPTLPKGIVKPTIITGLEAIGRSQDLDKLDMFMRDMTAMGQPALAMLNMEELVKRRAAALGIDIKDLIKTQAQIQQEQQQAQMMQLAQAATPNAVKGISDHINNAQTANMGGVAPQGAMAPPVQ